MPRPNPGWLALCTSVILHTLAALFVWLPISKQAGRGDLTPLQLEAVVEAPEVEVDLEEPRSRISLPPPPVKHPPNNTEQSIGPAPIIQANWTDTGGDRPSPAAFAPVRGNGAGTGLRGSAPPGMTRTPGIARSSPGSVSFFGVSARAKSVVYVIDRSASMGLEGGLEAAKRELAASLAALESDVRFQVVFYNRHAETVSMGESLLCATVANRQLALRSLEMVRAEGGTNHVAGLTCALTLHPEVVYFLTDADDLRQAQVATITRANHERISINTILLSRSTHGAASDSLSNLAARNRGVYRTAYFAER